MVNQKNHRNAVEGSANTLCFTQLDEVALTFFNFFSNPD